MAKGPFITPLEIRKILEIYARDPSMRAKEVRAKLESDLPESPPMVCDVVGCGRILQKYPMLEGGSVQPGAEIPLKLPDIQSVLAV